MPFTDEQADPLRALLLQLVPVDGSSTGNSRLRGQWFARARELYQVALDLKDYWNVRETLLRSGEIEKGRGKGGSVHRVIAAAVPGVAEAEAPPEIARELDLYPALIETIRTFYAPDYEMEHFICQDTAFQGRRNTGGRWTRPDITLVAVRKYEFVPGESVEVTTFEVKPLNALGVVGVFEAAAHSAFSHRSCLLVQIPEQMERDEHFDRLVSECRRFGITLITFVQPNDYDTFQVEYEADLANPSAGAVDDFVRTQLNTENKNKIREFLNRHNVRRLQPE